MQVASQAVSTWAPQRTGDVPLTIRLDGFSPLSLSASERAATIALVGGKACNLGRIAAQGFPVPRGFVLTTAAFQIGVDTMLASAPSLHAAAEWLCAAPLPEVVREAVLREVRALGVARPLAVRSSASEEDGTERSFAGQQVSVLNVRGERALLAAIREVWASLLRVEALLYRGRARLDGLPPSMAVIVQELVDADVAGVLFTANPIDAERNEMLVCSAYGLGETVVGGQRSDTFYVGRDSGRIRREVVAKPEALEPSPDGGLVERHVEAELQDVPSLDDAELRQLYAIGQELERVLGAALDIEFAFHTHDGRAQLAILQARPITTRPRASGHGGQPVYSNANVGEALPGVGTPMTWSIIHAFASRGFETAFGALGLDVPPSYELVSSFRGRVYLNISEFVSIASQIPLLTVSTLTKLGGVIDLKGLEGTFERLGSGPFLRRLPLTAPRLALSQLAMPVVARQWARQFRRRRDAFFARELRELPIDRLFAELREVDDVFNRTGEVMLASASNFLMSYVVVSEALALLGGPLAAAREPELFSGLTGVASAGPGLELLALARYVRDKPALARVFVSDEGPRPIDEVLEQLEHDPAALAFSQRLASYLRRWGHRAAREAEIATPRWREDPSFLVRVIQQHLMAPHLPSPEAIERDAARHREEVTQFIRQHFVTGAGLLFRGLLKWSQRRAREREELRGYVVDTLGMYRAVFLELGRRLVAAGALCALDDVFFISYGEARRWLEQVDGEHVDLRWRVAYRHAAYTAFVNSPDPPDTFSLAQEQVVSADHRPDPNCHVIEGLPGAPGRVTGRARVLLNIDRGEIPIRQGEILVTHFTDVGWTPLFLVAAGVVAERGGPLSHSCVVAREYGIPAVVGAQGATEAIHTGDTITVDGLNGVVYIAR